MDNLSHACLACGLGQSHGAHDVDAGVELGSTTDFRTSIWAGEMEHDFRLAVPDQRVEVTGDDVGLDEFRWSLSRAGSRFTSRPVARLSIPTTVPVPPAGDLPTSIRPAAPVTSVRMRVI